VRFFITIYACKIAERKLGPLAKADKEKYDLKKSYQYIGLYIRDDTVKKTIQPI
jgi:hypothetical protein